MVTMKAKKAAVTGFAALLLAGGAVVASIDSAQAQGKAGLGAGFRGSPGVYGGGGGRGFGGGGFGGGRAVVGGGGYGRGFGGGYGRGFGRGGYAYRGGYGYRRGYGGGALAAGVVGGLALGALAAGSSGYYGGYGGYAPAYYGGGYAPAGYAGECYLADQEVVNQYGEISVRRVQVCE